MISPYCPSQETEVPEVIGTLTLVITRPRAGESRASRDFTNELVTLGNLSPLIFLALPAISEIDFPWPLHLADFQKRVSALFSSFLTELSFSLDQVKDLSMQSFCLDLLNLPVKSAK